MGSSFGAGKSGARSVMHQENNKGVQGASLDESLTQRALVRPTHDSMCLRVQIQAAAYGHGGIGSRGHLDASGAEVGVES